MAHEEVFERYERLSQAHGTLCSIAVLVFFPLGAIFLRFARWYPVSLHKWTQLFGCTIYLAGFIAAAILWAHLTGGSEWSLGSHGTLGLVVSICVCLQAVLGLWNHRRYQIPLARLGGSQVSAPSRIMVTAWIHILLGWFIVLAGIANGGLGIYQPTRELHRRRHEPVAFSITYGVVAGVVGAVFCIALSWSWMRRIRQGWIDSMAGERDVGHKLRNPQERVQLREARDAVSLP